MSRSRRRVAAPDRRSADLLIRDATLADTVAICRTRDAAIRDQAGSRYTTDQIESWIGAAHPGWFARAMTVGGERFRVAERGRGNVVGYCATRHNEVAALYVHPISARTGTGRALLVDAERTIAAGGHERAWVGASLNGLAFYVRHGYSVVCYDIWASWGGLDVAMVRLEKSLMSGEGETR